ncbi:MAG: universal stress protein, partial [Candidatus Methanomethylophilaceae archaeon]|nr:universal stress protein [Candidatus Methanomethylophilaceae archaeon]
MEFKNILVPTDGSEYTETAIEAAVEFAKKINGKITALYVLDQTMIANMPMDTAVRNVYDSLAAEGKEAVDSVRVKAEAAGVPVDISVKEGSPVKVILDESSKYDLIIMG